MAEIFYLSEAINLYPVLVVRCFRFGVWIWTVPFFVSLLLFDQQGNLRIDFVLFKLCMALCVVGATAIANRKRTLTLHVTLGSLGVAILLDVVVLGLLLKQPVIEILTQVAPVYLLALATVVIMKPNSQDGEERNVLES
jgi:hypothetical protein